MLRICKAILCLAAIVTLAGCGQHRFHKTSDGYI